jgi:hypothetical protein
VLHHYQGRAIAGQARGTYQMKIVSTFMADNGRLFSNAEAAAASDLESVLEDERVTLVQCHFIIKNYQQVIQILKEYESYNNVKLPEVGQPLEGDRNGVKTT